MNYKESVAYIESLVPTLERPALARIQLFMAEENDIQNNYKCFHVGGTNGKGSTATILETILLNEGLKVGKFTGPHIMRFNERFSINGKTIVDQEFAEIATIVRERSDEFAARHTDLGRLTWFEFLTAMAFFFFAKNEIDCAVLEVGLGGRFDATNISNNVAATIITNIDLDHMHILGDTVEKIAFEKAGIMRKDVPAITGAAGMGLVELRSEAQKKGANLIEMPGAKADFIPISKAGTVEAALDCLSLSGPHQRGNAEMAIVALLESKFLSPPDRFLDHLAESLQRVYFAGRMQFVNNKILIIDGAHNPAGAKALRRALDERLRKRDASGGAQSAGLSEDAQVETKRPAMHKSERSSASPAEKLRGYCFILGFFGNKNVPEFLQELLRKGDRVIAVEADVRRSTYPKEEIVARCAELGIEATLAPSMGEALKLARVEDRLVAAAAGVSKTPSHASAQCSGLEQTPQSGFATPGTVEKAFEGNQVRASDNRVDTDCEVVVTGSFAVLKELMLTLGWQTVDDGRDFALSS